MPPDNKPLTPMQRRILFWMRGGKYAVFYPPRDSHGRRTWGRMEISAEKCAEVGVQGLIAIRAYQSPYHPLRVRGLIVASLDTKFGVFFKLTEHGEHRAAKIKEPPR